MAAYCTCPCNDGSDKSCSYPGVRCDIPSPGYQFTFESNTQWSEFYASGGEIQEYLVQTARKFDVYRFCKFRRLFKSAVWNEHDGKWEVEIEDLETHEVGRPDSFWLCVLTSTR